MTEDNNNVFLAIGDAIFAFRVIVTTVGLFQKILLNAMAHMYCPT